MGFQMESGFDNVVNIKVIGVGGGGAPGVTRMVKDDQKGEQKSPSSTE